jgi:hypothetical protein
MAGQIQNERKFWAQKFRIPSSNTHHKSQTAEQVCEPLPASSHKGRPLSKP